MAKLSKKAKSLAAKRAWETIRANRALAAVAAKPKPVEVKTSTTVSPYTAQYRALLETTPLVAPKKKEKLVKGLIKTDANLADWEKKGQFGVSNINARGLTKCDILGEASHKATSVLTPCAKPCGEIPLTAYPVYELLTEKNWIQGDEALDEAGTPVRPTDPKAVKFDLSGALQRCYKTDFAYAEAERKLLVVLRNRGDTSIVAFNDAAGRLFCTVREVIRYAGV